MKKKSIFTLIILLIFLFPDFSAADQVVSKSPPYGKSDPEQTLETQCKQPSNPATPDPAKKKKDKSETDKVSDIVRKKIDKEKWKEPRYCRPVLQFWCHRICGDVSPCTPGASKKKDKIWGKRCTPQLLSKCERCEF